MRTKQENAMAVHKQSDIILLDANGNFVESDDEIPVFVLKGINDDEDEDDELQKLSFELPLDVKDMIRAVPLQIYGEKQDNLVWKGSQDGDFHLASASKLARLETTDVQTFHGNWIWKLDTLPKVKHFLWLCCHNSVPVKKVLESRGIIHDACCPLCRNHEETILHTLKGLPSCNEFLAKVSNPPKHVQLHALELGRLAEHKLPRQQTEPNKWYSLVYKNCLSLGCVEPVEA